MTSVAGVDQSPCVAMPKYTQLPLRTAPTYLMSPFRTCSGTPVPSVASPLVMPSSKALTFDW